MEVGIIVHNAGAKATVENIVKTAQWAEKLGYHALWLTDHVVLAEEVKAWYPYRTHGRWDYPPDTKWLDPLLTLAWAGAAAPSLKLGTSVLVLPIRNPVLLAKQLASLDFLTGGRVMVGAGAGWMEEEFKLIGENFENRGKRAVEMVQLMRQLWTGETVNFQGEFYRLSNCKMHPRPVQAAIPIFWGGHSEAALKRVAKVGDGWHPTQITLEQLEEGIKKLRHHCAEFGRDFNSVKIIARPGDKYDITPETHARHLELGIHHLVVDTPIKQEDPDLSLMRAKMERAAQVCGLTPRSVHASQAYH
jgi:probable F420-dependent oxidoreductase